MDDGKPRLLLRDEYICQVYGNRIRKLCRIDGEILHFWSKDAKVEFPVTLDDLRRLMDLAARKSGKLK
jgi:hypothetical protein